MPVNAVLFDLGGTLLHYHDPQSDDLQRPFRRVTMQGVAAVVRKLSDGGAVLPGVDEIASMVDKHIGIEYRGALSDLRGGSIEKPVRSALVELGVTVSDTEWSALRPLLYEAINHIVSPRLGCRETLETLTRQGYKIALISNTYWAGDLHDRHVAQYGLIDFLSVRVYSSDEPHQKPHPAIFQRTLEKIGATPSESVYIGDRIDVDIAGAHRAGMKAVLIHSPYIEVDNAPQGDPAEMTPDAAINELPDLPAILSQL
jgi:HAD superfamily hydrolase (TIGR01662 family)